MAKLTRWFAGTVRPVRAGVYEVRWAGRPDHTFHQAPHPQYQHWDGLVWSGWAWSTQMAEHNAGVVSSRQQPEWRGFTSEQK